MSSKTAIVLHRVKTYKAMPIKRGGKQVGILMEIEQECGEMVSLSLFSVEPKDEKTRKGT